MSVSVHSLFRKLNKRADEEENPFTDYEKELAKYNRLIRCLPSDKRIEVSLVLRDMIRLYEKMNGAIMTKGLTGKEKVILDAEEEKIYSFNFGIFPERLRVILLMCLSEYIFP